MMVVQAVGCRDSDLSSSHYSNVRLVTGPARPAFDIRSSIVMLTSQQLLTSGKLALFSFSVGKEGEEGKERKERKVVKEKFLYSI